MKSHITQSYTNALTTLQTFLAHPDNIELTVTIAEKMAQLFQTGNKIIICGNGGSACDAMHFAEEFTGRYRKNRRPLPVIALCDPTHITCVGNDYGFDAIFSRGVDAFGKPGDMFIGISTSGNSPNVINAHDKAQELGLITFNLLGKDGGKLAGKGTYEFIIPGETSDRIQELHMTILHIIIEGVERRLFPELY